MFGFTVAENLGYARVDISESIAAGAARRREVPSTRRGKTAPPPISAWIEHQLSHLVADPIVVVDGGGTIRHVNAAARKFLDQGAVGRSLVDCDEFAFLHTDRSEAEVVALCRMIHECPGHPFMLARCSVHLEACVASRDGARETIRPI